MLMKGICLLLGLEGCLVSRVLRFVCLSRRSLVAGQAHYWLQMHCPAGCLLYHLLVADPDLCPLWTLAEIIHRDQYHIVVIYGTCCSLCCSGHGLIWDRFDS